MAEILTPTKALTVNPLKASQPIGASLAFLGLADAMPLEHGARGCTSFNKLFFMRHFNEPIALQTTAMDQTTTVLGADDNVVEALATICAKNAPRVIGLITTGLSEMQGADVPRTISGIPQGASRIRRCRGRSGQRQRHARLPRNRLRRRGRGDRRARWFPRRAGAREEPRQVNVLASGDADAGRHRRAARLDRGLRPHARSSCPISATRSTAI